MKHDTQEEYFRLMYDMYNKSVFRVAYSILKNIDAANDVVQDVFLKALKQPEEKLAGHEIQWLFVVTRNTSIKVLKKHERLLNLGDCDFGLNKKNTKENLASQILDIDSVVCHKSPNKKMLQAEQQQLCKKNVNKAIKKLPPRLQELIKLRFFKNLSYNQIAEKKSLTTGNVGFLLNRATTKLKKILKNDRELLNEV